MSIRACASVSEQRAWERGRQDGCESCTAIHLGTHPPNSSPTRCSRACSRFWWQLVPSMRRRLSLSLSLSLSLDRSLVCAARRAGPTHHASLGANWKPQCAVGSLGRIQDNSPGLWSCSVSSHLIISLPCQVLAFCSLSRDVRLFRHGATVHAARYSPSSDGGGGCAGAAIPLPVRPSCSGAEWMQLGSCTIVT
jgi:hypothetical protein